MTEAPAPAPQPLGSLSAGADVLHSLFDVLEKQQSTIRALREELVATRSEMAKTKDTLSEEVGQLRQSVESRRHMFDDSDDEEEHEVCVLLEETDDTTALLNETMEKLEDPPVSIEIQDKGDNWNHTFRVLRFKNRLEATRARALLEALAVQRESLQEAPKHRESLHETPKPKKKSVSFENPSESVGDDASDASSFPDADGPPAPPRRSDDSLEQYHQTRRSVATIVDAPSRKASHRKVSHKVFEDATNAVLVRHVRDRRSLLGLLDLLQILEPELTPSNLDKFGLHEFWFPDQLKATTAVNLIHGLEFGGARIEATLVGSNMRRTQLEHDFDRLLRKGRDASELLARTVVFSSLPSAATEKDVRPLCPEAVEFTILKNAFGTRDEFGIGKAVFHSEDDAKKVADRLLTWRFFDEAFSVSGQVLEIPMEEILKRRLEALESEVYEARKDVIARSAANSEAIVQLEDDVAAVAKSTKDAQHRIGSLWTQSAQFTELKLDHGKMDSRIAKVERDYSRLSTGRQNVVDDAVQGAKDAVLAELEKLSILVSAPSGGPNGRGSAFVVSDEIFAAANLQHELATLKHKLDDVSSTFSRRLEKRLGTRSLRALCQRIAQPEQPLDDEINDDDDDQTNPLEILMEQIRLEMAAGLEGKAEKRALEASSSAVAARLEKRLEEMADKERLETESRVSRVTKSIDGLFGRVNETEKDVGLLTKRVDNIKVDPLRAALATIEADFETSAASTNETLSRLRLDLDRVAAENDDKPTTHLVETMLGALGEDLRADLDGASSKLTTAIDNITRSSNRSVSKDDVVALIAHHASNILNAHQPPDDTMMVGALQYRCLGCAKLNGNVHGVHADKVVHSGLRPIPSTQAPPHPYRPNGTTSVDSSPQHLAAYATAGRGGALRPLRRHVPPSTPIPGRPSTSGHLYR